MIVSRVTLQERRLPIPPLRSTRCSAMHFAVGARLCRLLHKKWQKAMQQQQVPHPLQLADSCFFLSAISAVPPE